MARKIIYCILCIAVMAGNIAAISPRAKKQAPQQRNLLRTIVIDPGHGGKDEGAHGADSYEKDVCLAVGLKLQAQIQADMPGVKVVMTRTTDTYPSLYARANMANAAGGDLFISIHCNDAAPVTHREFTGYETQTYYKGKGAKRKKLTRKVAQYRTWTTPNPAKGTETYVWAMRKNEDKVLAMRENESLYLDSAGAQMADNFDPDSPEKRILYALKTQQYFNRSSNLAMTVEDEFVKVGRISREAKQRQVGLWVLQATAMPSILIETGFISNPEEEEYLNSEDGQQEIANVVVRALKRYKYSLEHHTLANLDSTAVRN